MIRADDLALYYFPTCPYCRRVLRALEELGVELELRNIRSEIVFEAELVRARGRSTVPVLRIRGAGGAEDTWMPESLDIVAYLKERFSVA